MKILDARQTTTSAVFINLAPIGQPYISFGSDFVEINQEMKFASASANIDLASMQSLTDSKFNVTLVKTYFEEKFREELEEMQVDLLFENPSKNKNVDLNRRNFAITIYQQELQFSKVYDLYMKGSRLDQFHFSVNLDLYRDELRYLGNAADGTENYLLNDIRDNQNFGCKFKIQTYFFEAFI